MGATKQEHVGEEPNYHPSTNSRNHHAFHPNALPKRNHGVAEGKTGIPPGMVNSGVKVRPPPSMETKEIGGESTTIENSVMKKIQAKFSEIQLPPHGTDDHNNQ